MGKSAGSLDQTAGQQGGTGGNCGRLPSEFSSDSRPTNRCCQEPPLLNRLSEAGSREFEDESTDLLSPAMGQRGGTEGGRGAHARVVTVVL